MTTHCWCGKALVKDQLRRGGKYCSPAHSQRFRNTLPRAVRRRWAEKAIAARRHRFTVRVVHAIVADLKAHMVGPDVVSVAAAVKVVLKHRRLAYHNGWSANYQRRLRAAG